MPEEVTNYLVQEEVGVLAVEMPDGAPHAATVHFAKADKLTLLILTDRTSRKAQAFSTRKETRASFVLGTAGDSDTTLQFDGLIRVTEDAGLIEHYFGRYPKKREKWKGPDVLFLAFTPTWWRFTDYTNGKRILTSE